MDWTLCISILALFVSSASAYYTYKQKSLTLFEKRNEHYLKIISLIKTLEELFPEENFKEINYGMKKIENCKEELFVLKTSAENLFKGVGYEYEKKLYELICSFKVTIKDYEQTLTIEPKIYSELKDHLKNANNTFKKYLDIL